MNNMEKEQLSSFDIFKIGIGPSSSHTLGPWRAAQQFIQSLQTLETVTGIKALLYGSLAKTGHGHGTDIAIQLGLSGHDPVTMDVSSVDTEIQSILTKNELLLDGKKAIVFSPDDDILFLSGESLPAHPNAVTFQAFLNNGTAFSETYYSIGGGFVLKEGEQKQSNKPQVDLPFPIENAAALLHWCLT